MKWFRLYHDLPNDRKLRRFSPQQKWAWVVLLCIASENKERGFVLNEDESDIADFCGFECIQDYLYFLDKLRQKDMITPAEGGFKITHWEDRQYVKPSDMPEATRERKRRQRERERDEHDDVSRVTQRDESVMSRHTDTDPYSETEQNRTEQKNISGSKASEEEAAEIYNQYKPSKWAALAKRNGKYTLNADRKKKLAKLKRDAKSMDVSWQELMISALKFASQDNWWANTHKGSFESIFRDSRYIQFSDSFEDLNLNDRESFKDVFAQISAQLERLNRSAALPREWTKQTGKQIVSQLSSSEAQAYLLELKSTGVRA